MVLSNLNLSNKQCLPLCWAQVAGGAFLQGLTRAHVLQTDVCSLTVHAFCAHALVCTDVHRHVHRPPSVCVAGICNGTAQAGQPKAATAGGRYWVPLLHVQCH